MKLLKKFFLAGSLVLVLFQGQVLAQSTIKIQGRVLTVSGEPLVGAHVVVLGTGIGTTTNHAGRFELEDLFIGEYNLRATFIGYHEQQKNNIVVEIERAAVVDFVLHEKVLRLDGVVIEAKSPDPERSEFYTTITEAEIADGPYQSVADLLDQNAEVEIIVDGNGKKQVSIRGSDPKQVLILLDGVPLNSSLFGETDLESISLAGIQRINIWKGGSSYRFGSGALGGAIEIISKSFSEKRIGVTTDMGSFGDYSLKPAFAGTYKNIGLIGTLEARWHEGDFPYSYARLDGARVQDSRINGDFQSKGIHLRANINKGIHHASLQFNILDTERGLPGLIYSWTPFARAFNLRRMIIGQYQVRSPEWSAELYVSNHRNDSEFINEPPADAEPRFRTVPPYHNRNRVKSNTVKLTFNRSTRMFAELSLTHVAFKELARRFDPAFRPGEATNMNLAASMSGEFRINPASLLSELLIQPSLRYDMLRFSHVDANRTDNHVSPHLGIIAAWKGNWIFRIKSNISRSFRSPTFADLFYQDFRVAGNPDLLPEKSLDFDVGVQAELPFLGWMNLEASYYRHRIDDHIVWELGSFATFQPMNADALLEGYDLKSTWSLLKDRIELRVGHLTTNARNKVNDRITYDKYLTYRPSYSTRIALLFRWDPFEFKINNSFVGRRFVTSSNTIDLSPYSVEDLIIRMKTSFLNSQMKLAASINNIFNERYEITDRAPMPGRHFRISIELSR